MYYDNMLKINKVFTWRELKHSFYRNCNVNMAISYFTIFRMPIYHAGGGRGRY